MTPEEVQALAQRIADFLSARAESGRASGSDPDPGSVARPSTSPGKKPRARGREDVGWYRAAYGELTAAVRAAAAGSGPSPGRVAVSSALSRRDGGPHSVPVAVSNRHVHLCQADIHRLFGPEHQLTSDRPIEQPGQFAAHERVRVVGPAGAGAIADVRVVGPARKATQVELSASDAHAIGVSATIRASGTTAGSAAVRLEGPAGAVDLPGGAIVAARHLHVSVGDGARMGLSDGDRVTLLIGSGDRRATLHDVLVRLGKRHATELHVDTDEARAYGVGRGATAVLVARGSGGGGGGRTRAMPSEGGRRVVTERDVEAIAAAGRSLSRGPRCIITPAAIDRAKAFGIWRE